MTTLCDRDLRLALRATSGLRVEPYPEGRIQPSTIDLLLSSVFLVPRPRDFSSTEPYWPLVSMARSERKFPEYTTYDQARLDLQPGQFLLASTLERVSIPPHLRARVEGKSTLGRLGLLVHCTAGYIDPGFSGNITLELYNVAPYPITLVAGAPVCQLSVEQLSGVPDALYGSQGLGSHYQGSVGTVGAKLQPEPQDESVWPFSTL